MTHRFVHVLANQSVLFDQVKVRQTPAPPAPIYCVCGLVVTLREKSVCSLHNHTSDMSELLLVYFWRLQATHMLEWVFVRMFRTNQHKYRVRNKIRALQITVDKIEKVCLAY